MVVAYVMAKKKCDVDTAIATVQRSRSFVRPNDGFLVQLAMWQDVVCYGGPRRVDCELCIRKKSTKWFSEQPLFIVMQCDSCDLPMVRTTQLLSRSRSGCHSARRLLH